MQKRKWAYYISKFTLIDEILGLLYWALAIYGIFVLLSYLSNKLVIGVVLCAYIVLVVVIYIYVLKKVTAFFKNKTE
ncbi:hypothetical protein DN062_18160 [Nitrincola tibetensis]|uniref:Uncharacterized protein n=1 Tax=Nitrincola tibetensis TaxID=2219697 RepID=A0A364NHT4_9GAMM|nr:hypothetical protein DN062_18160 [Nitrincola tibetensis]